MKKNILKIITFFLILLILLLIVSYIFIPKNNTKEAGMEEQESLGILAEKKDSVDVVVYGDSEPMASIIPMKLWDDYGFTAYSCTHAGQTLPDTCKMVWDSLQNQNPKIVILEANNSYIETKITVPMARIINGVMPITKYHNRWKNLKLNDFFGPIEYTNKEVNKGYYYVGDVKPADASNYMVYSEQKENISKMNKIYIKLIKKYVEAKGAKFIMVSVPNTKNWSYARHNAMEEFTKQENIEFLDMNYLKDELQIDWQTETGDEGEHVNYKGALKVTDYLGKWLENKGILENHKNNTEYSEWNDNLKVFKQNIEELNKKNSLSIE